MGRAPPENTVFTIGRLGWEELSGKPVLGLTEKRGKLEEETVRPMRWPRSKICETSPMLKFARSSFPGTRGGDVAVAKAPARHRMRAMPSCTSIWVPSGQTSTSLAVKSVSSASELTQSCAVTLPTTARVCASGSELKRTKSDLPSSTSRWS